MGLVSRRLAVIDIAGGGSRCRPRTGLTRSSTTASSSTPTTVAKLEAAGHRFRSRCDTEVRPARLRGVGPGRRWSGSTACGRSRSGTARAAGCSSRATGSASSRWSTPGRPAAWCSRSEIKALIASGLVARELDRSALPHYLSSFAVPEPHSLVGGVRRLPAGPHADGRRDGRQRAPVLGLRRFPRRRTGGAERYREEVEELLEDSVRPAAGQRRAARRPAVGRRRLADWSRRSRRATAKRPLRTFTLGFDVPEADERPPRGAWRGRWARDTPRDGSMPQRRGPEPARPARGLRRARAVAAADAFHLRASRPGRHRRAVRARWRRAVHRLSDPRRRERALAVRPAPARPSRAGAGAGAGAPGPAARAAAAARPRWTPTSAASRDCMHQTGARLRERACSRRTSGRASTSTPRRASSRSTSSARRATHPLNRMLYVYLKTYLADELLRASDAMSMLHSLEVRTPFLDYRLVERAMRMPARHKMRGTRANCCCARWPSRWSRRRCTRKKRGFSPPMASWLRGELESRCASSLSRRSVRRRGRLRPRMP